MGIWAIVIFVLINIPVVGLLAYWLTAKPADTRGPIAGQALQRFQSRLRSVLDIAESTRGRFSNYLTTGTLGGRQVAEFVPSSEAELQELTSSFDVSVEEARELGRFLSQFRQAIEECEDRIQEMLPDEAERADDSHANDAAEPDGKSRPAGETSNGYEICIDDFLKPAPGGEQRTAERHSMTFMVSALPLNHVFDIDGPWFEGLARELSRGGLSFCHTRAVNAPYLAMELLPVDSSPIYVILRVSHSRVIGPYFVTGGQFERRLASGSLINALKDYRAQQEEPALV